MTFCFEKSMRFCVFFCIEKLLALILMAMEREVDMTEVLATILWDSFGQSYSDETQSRHGQPNV